MTTKPKKEEEAPQNKTKKTYQLVDEKILIQFNLTKGAINTRH
jgi:hypothetical protein